MGYAECSMSMESRRGSVSSGARCSPGTRGQALKSNPFCPPSTSKLTQSIVKDHMLSHYKKIYSAKAAIDASVPKSLIHSVKYNDRIKQEQLQKGGRPQSAHSLSQKNGRASCFSPQSRLSVQYDDSTYLCSRNSSPRFGTSFHAKEIVYPSHEAGSQSRFHLTLPESEIMYRNPERTLQRKQTAGTLEASGNQSCYKTFQDPVQKTYSGDLLKKHSQHFTRDKPFTPKTLKSDKSSYLSNYRYYRAPERRPTQDCTQSRLMRQETYHGSTKTKKHMQELYVPSQGFNTEHEWSDDELNSTYLLAPRQLSRASKSTNRDSIRSPSRVSPRGGKSPIMRNISAEEEELMYLEFVSAVTEEILSRGQISDRVLDRVTKRHIDMNRHHLDEGKMRHLLEVLRKDFEAPTNIPTSSRAFERQKNGPLDAFLAHLDPEGKQVSAKENNDLFSSASLTKYCNSPDYTDRLFVSTPLYSPARTPSPTKTIEKDGEDDRLERGVSSPWPSVHAPSNEANSEEDFNQNQMGTTTSDNEDHEYVTTISDKGADQDQAEITYDGHSEELEDLGRSMSESLHVSSNAPCDDAETADKHEDTAAVSDDGF